MSKFFCDTNSEIPYSLAEELNINVIRMPYTIDGEMFFYDLGLNTDLSLFFEKMRKGASVKTQALNLNDYLEYFEPVLAEGDDIMYVTFSHKMSGTFQSMQMAIDELKEKYPSRKITVADSRNISMGAGRVVIESAKLHNSGATDDEIVQFVNEFSARTQTYFTVDDLEYLKRGGRLSSFKAFMGKVLNLKPIIATVDGTLQSLGTSKGRKKALNDMRDVLEKHDVDVAYPITIMQASSDSDAEILTELVLEKYPNANIQQHAIGPVIGCHCGPGTVGIIFVSKKK